MQVDTAVVVEAIYIIHSYIYYAYIYIHIHTTHADRQDAIQITKETGGLFIYIYINTCIQAYTAIHIATYIYT